MHALHSLILICPPILMYRAEMGGFDMHSGGMEARYARAMSNTAQVPLALYNRPSPTPCSFLPHTTPPSIATPNKYLQGPRKEVFFSYGPDAKKKKKKNRG